MLVHEWMTTDVVSITPETSMMKAARIMKDKRVGRLPVVDEKNRLVGIVSDRDIKDASPSKATTLDTHELYYLLSEMKVKDIMTKNPFAAKKNDSVEYIADMMTKKRFGGVPVVEDDNTLCGIITDNDIFKLLISITGVNIGGIQLAFDVPNRKNSLRDILDALRELEANVVSVLSLQENQDSANRRIYIRLRPLDKAHETKVIEVMKANFPLIYWIPALASKLAQ